MRFGLGLLLAALVAAAPARAEELTAADRQELATLVYLNDQISQTSILYARVYGQAELWQKLTGQVVCVRNDDILNKLNLVNAISFGPFAPPVLDANLYLGTTFDLDVWYLDTHIWAGLVTWQLQLDAVAACQAAVNAKLKSIGL